MADLSLNLSRDLSDVLEGIARVITAAIGYREVEDFSAMEAGPAVVVHQGFQVAWLGDRNTGKFADQPTERVEMVNRIEIVLGRQVLPGADDSGISLRRKVRRELETTVRQAVIRGMMSDQTEDLAVLRVGYISSTPITDIENDWMVLRVRFAVVSMLTLSTD